MKKTFIIMSLLMVFLLSFFSYSQAERSNVAAIVELQTIDIGGFWIGGQLNTNAAFKIPGKHFQPENLSLTYIYKSQGYEGWQLRGSLDYTMSENFYSGYGLGFAKLEAVNLLVGTVKTGMEIPVTSFMNLRGELIGYVPIWNMTDSDDRKSVFYGANIGIGF